MLHQWFVFEPKRQTIWGMTWLYKRLGHFYTFDGLFLKRVLKNCNLSHGSEGLFFISLQSSTVTEFVSYTYHSQTAAWCGFIYISPFLQLDKFIIFAFILNISTQHLLNTCCGVPLQPWNTAMCIYAAWVFASGKCKEHLTFKLWWMSFYVFSPHIPSGKFSDLVSDWES